MEVLKQSQVLFGVHGRTMQLKPYMQPQVKVEVHGRTNSSVSTSDQPRSRALLVQSVRGVSERNDVPG